MLQQNFKYRKWHDTIIEKAKNRVLPDNIYVEKHHILPKSMGGTNDISNLVNLTAKEHFIVHLLLTKIYSCAEVYSALYFMKNLMKRPITSKLYERVKQEHSKLRSKKYSGKNNPRYGKKCSNITKTRISEALQGKSLSPETRQKMRDAHKRRRDAGIPGNQLGKKLPRKPNWINPLKGIKQSPTIVEVRMRSLQRDKNGKFCSINQ